MGSFIKNVCFVFDNPEEAFAKEFELIETYREDPLCYNLRQGGSGGFDYINDKVPIDYAARGKQGWVVREKIFEGKIKHWLDGEYGKRLWPRLLSNKAWVSKRSSSVRAAWIGRQHSTETKEKMSLAARTRIGQSNSQFGTCWVALNGAVKKIKKKELQSYLDSGWSRGRR